MNRSFRVVQVAAGRPGVESALAAVHALFEEEQSVALVPAGDERALAAVRPGEPLHTDEPTLILATSGSTGTAKAVELGLAALAAAAEAAAIQLRSQACWLTALPVTGIGGLNTVIRSALAGTAPVIWDGVAGAANFNATEFTPYLEAVVRSARKQRLAAATSLVPTQLHRLAESEAALAALAEVDYVLVGGGGLAPELAARAKAAGINLIRTYGATETGGGIVYDGRALPGCEVRVEDGEVVLAGPTLAHCYRDGREIPAAGWPSGDVGELAGGELRVTGRRDSQVKVAGHKVDLVALAAAAGDAVMAAATSRPDAEYGEVPLVAYAGEVAVAEVTSRLRAALPVPALPLVVLRVAELPLLPGGKPDLPAIVALCETLRP